MTTKALLTRIFETLIDAENIHDAHDCGCRYPTNRTLCVAHKVERWYKEKLSEDTVGCRYPETNCVLLGRVKT